MGRFASQEALFFQRSLRSEKYRSWAFSQSHLPSPMPRLRESSEIPQAGFNVVQQFKTSHALSKDVANSQEGSGRCSGLLNIVLETAHPYEVPDGLSRLWLNAVPKCLSHLPKGTANRRKV